MENNNTLAKISIAISVVLLILVIVLFTKLPSNQTAKNQSSSNDSNVVDKINLSNQAAVNSNIVFFNMDSLNGKLDLYKEIESEMKKANDNAERKMRNKQAEITTWEKKWQSKGKLLSTEEQQYMMEAQQMQQDAMQFEQNVQMKLAQEQEELMLTYATRISNHCKEFAQKNGYDAVLAYTFGQNVWYYNQNLDVTNQLAQQMNAAYAESTGKSNSTEE
jgi:Skp family chaperone for outer membrane proteins